jgi:hypothetical protein
MLGDPLAAVTSRTFSMLSQLRGKRIVHPHGVGFKGVLMPAVSDLLARRTVSGNADSGHGADLSAIGEEIEEDKQALAEVMKRLGVGRLTAPAPCRRGAARTPLPTEGTAEAAHQSQTRSVTRPAASATSAQEIARRAPSSGEAILLTERGMELPSSRRCSPLREAVLRRRSRTGVERRR